VERFAGLDDASVLAVYVDDHRSAGERETAFFELTRRYQHRLFAICFRVLGSSSDAEDAVQETLLRLARKAADFRGEAQLSTWLYRVAHNVCTDRIRHDARRPSTPVDDLTQVGDEPVAEDLLTAHDTARALEAALAQLDERSRTLVLLVGVDGLSYAEAAEAVGVAVGTAKSRVSRARAELGRLLADQDEDAPAPVERARGEGTTPRPDAVGPLDARGPPDA
jgi:RNA polymerase sigma-70 factor, ECF subfamily